MCLLFSLSGCIWCRYCAWGLLVVCLVLLLGGLCSLVRILGSSVFAVYGLRMLLYTVGFELRVCWLLVMVA